MYFHGVQHNARKTTGNINILTIGANIINYTLVIELYNFTNNRQQLEAIGLKLKAIFAMKVKCFTGLHHKADYTLLRKQYSNFNLEQSKDLERLMDDVGMMAVNRGVTTRGKDKTKLHILMRGQGMSLNKPNNVRVGTCFASTRGSLSREAQVYCQLDVEAPLVLHQLYSGLPDLTLRMTRETPNIGDMVDIMSESSRSIEPIAQGVIKATDGTWGTSNYKIRRDQVLVQVKKVFNGKGVLHYPADGNNMKKCKCGRRSHGAVIADCDYYLFYHIGPPPFTIIETKSRLRRCNEQTTYGQCIYSDEGAASNTELVLNLPAPETIDEMEEDQHDDENNGEEDSVATKDDIHDNALTIAPDVEHLLVDNDEYGSDIDSDNEDVLEDDPTPEQVRLATSIEFQETLSKIISDADSLAQKESNETLNAADYDSDLPVDHLTNGNHKTVLADIFHLMDRAKLPMHHEYKSLFFRALRSSVFIMNDEDVDDVKRVLAGKVGMSWEQKLSFDFTYVAKRVRRRVPPPAILYHRMKAVFDFF